MRVETTIPDWVYASFEARDYTDMSCICNWAHALFEGPDGLSVEVMIAQVADSKPAIRVMAIDMREQAPLTPEVEAQVAAAVNPRVARLQAEIEAEANKPFERYLVKMVSTPDALVSLLAALEKELND